MRRLMAVRCFAGILGIAVALLTSAPAQADPDCPTGQITCPDRTGNCGLVQGRCVPPTADLLPPQLPVDTEFGIGFGVGF
jgi:hypothetical protein